MHIDYEWMALNFDNASEESFKTISYLPTRNVFNHIFQNISTSNYARFLHPKILNCFKELESAYNNICIEELRTRQQQKNGAMQLHSSNTTNNN